ncbi:Maternal effect embryo arrest 60 [Hibiscus syriacus]|uniref:Maternal effect embryo arrest 60 n=1 Tax=Hibiscus syriacus TaxID=106335 RepID=A0A6A2ZKU0_HIBSY|nr:Maternal effect embryo arrest 60 [Hibiscus syriacus]
MYSRLQILITTRKVSFTTGKEQEQAMEELTEQLKLLENELKGKPYFAGEAIGYLDIVVANFLVFWFRNLQEALGINMFTKERFPIIFKWIEKLVTIDVIEVCRIPKETSRLYPDSTRSHKVCFQVKPLE